ncbi:short gastrulation [Caerostris darwini]|uniref:Short gastrulation n=1 Tax=Caerostris darwini TaxID=1538125 RepID=A0AAV4UKX1_9ARAC|nr:short gastrulation [Caerostris darwini]
MGPYRALVSLLALGAVLGIAGAAVQGRKKVRPPLVGEESRRKVPKQTHCQFGNHTYELEERWRPDLGPPFGMLYCMRCECIPRVCRLICHWLSIRRGDGTDTRWQIESSACSASKEEDIVSTGRFFVIEIGDRGSK